MSQTEKTVEEENRPEFNVRHTVSFNGELMVSFYEFPVVVPYGRDGENDVEISIDYGELDDGREELEVEPSSKWDKEYDFDSCDTEEAVMEFITHNWDRIVKGDESPYVYKVDGEWK